MATKNVGKMFRVGAAMAALWLSASCYCTASSFAEKLDLDKDWQIRSSCEVDASGDQVSLQNFKTSGWTAATVPTTVVAALVKAKADSRYEDPYFGENLWKLSGMDYPRGEIFASLPFPNDSPFRCAWWFRHSFTVPPHMRGHQLWLNFGGINYKAEIWLNGKLLADSNSVAGAYRTYEYNVTDATRADGPNILAVKVFPPQPEDLGINWVDWNPAPPDKNMGLWRGVTLVSSGPVALRNPYVQSKVNTDTLSTADLSLTVEVRNTADKAIRGVLEAGFDDVRLKQTVSLDAKESRVVRFEPDKYPQLHIRNPLLWWPWQMGEPNLKTLQVTFQIDGQESDSKSTRFGIRTVTSEFDAKGRRLFRVNGKRILIRGAGWAPDMLLRESPDRTRQELEYVRHMGLNTVRLEGKLESDRFYDLADQKGLLVIAGWCCCDVWEQWDKWIPQNESIAAESLRSQVLRMRSHPSMLAWLNGSDNPPSVQVEKTYLNILKELEWPNPVVSSASEQDAKLTGPSGVKMLGPYDWIPPAYWTLDRGERGGAWGFNSETGPGPAIPTMESLRRFIPKDELWPIGKSWAAHAGIRQFGNLDLMLDALQKRYGDAKTLEEFVNKSQAIAYEGERAMFEAYSRNKYESTGVVQWMLNNAWPGVIWHLYDYFLNPGAGYFGARKANEPVHVLYGYDDHSVYLVNSTYTATGRLNVRAKVLDFDLKTRYAKETNVSLPADATGKVFEIPALEGLSTTYFVQLEARDETGRVVSRNFYWLSTKQDVLDWTKTTPWHTPVVQHAEVTELNTLRRVGLQLAMTSTRIGDRRAASTVRVKNPTSALAFMVHLRLVKSDAHPDPECNATTLRADCSEDVLPVFWSDNYFTLLPGEEREIQVEYPEREAGKAPVIVSEGWNIEPHRLALR